MKLRVQMDEVVDLDGVMDGEGYSSLGELLKDELKRQVEDAVREEVTKIMERHTREWIRKEFSKNGQLEERDGVIYLPLMLGGKNG